MVRRAHARLALAVYLPSGCQHFYLFKACLQALPAQHAQPGQLGSLPGDVGDAAANLCRSGCSSLGCFVGRPVKDQPLATFCEVVTALCLPAQASLSWRKPAVLHGLAVAEPAKSGGRPLLEALSLRTTAALWEVALGREFDVVLSAPRISGERDAAGDWRLETLLQARLCMPHMSGTHKYLTLSTDTDLNAVSRAGWRAFPPCLCAPRFWPAHKHLHTLY